MKKLLAAVLIVCIAAAFCACSSNGAKKNGLTVVTTVFPLYNWITEILGEKADEANVVWLMDNGVDLHSYQPAADDIVAVSSCDLIVYIGGESDAWADDVLREKSNEARCELNLLSVLGDAAKAEKTVEGMQTEEEEDSLEYDEHIWLSLRNAQTAVRAIARSLGACDPENADYYAANAEAYAAALAGLDEEFDAAVENAARKTLLFADRFPFRYLCDDYGLAYFAAFSGCSAESEASFETVAFLADKLTELALPAVCILDGSDTKLADTVIAASGIPNAEIVRLDSMQSAARKDAEAGRTYLDAMRDNLEALRKALN